MAGPSTIQRFPTGLLGWLGLKSGGDTPHEISNTIISTVDLAELYLLDRRRSAVAASNAISTQAYWGASTAGALTVPDGKMWLLRGHGLTVPPLAAGDAMTLQLCYFKASVSVGFFTTPPISTVALMSLAAGRVFDRPLILQAGDSLSCYVSAGTFATPRTATHAVDYYEVDV